MKFFKFKLILLVQLFFALNASAQINVMALINDAQADISKNNYFDAIRKLNICININPSEFHALFLRGACKYYLNDMLGAEQDLTNSLTIYNPMLYDAYHYRALVRYRLEKYADAIKDLNVVISKDNNDPQLYVERAFSKLSSMDFNGAISDCNKALSLHALGENVYLCKGSAEGALNDFENALKDYASALLINPDNIDVWVRLGITKAKMGNNKEAIEDYNKALKIDSGCTYAYFNRAQAEIELTKYKEARKDYNTVLKFEPLNAVVYFDRAILEMNMQEPKNAVTDFDKVLMLNPENIQALFNRAKIKTGMKDYKGALADYDKTISLFPYFVEAYYDRSLVKKSLGDFNGAKKDFDLSKIIGEMNRSKNSPQRERDSLDLTRLMELNADFSNVNPKKTDTVNVGLLPLFYITVKDSSNKHSVYYSPLLLPLSKGRHPYCLTNHESTVSTTSSDTVSEHLNDAAKEGKSLEVRLQQAIQKTNMQLFTEAAKEYDKLIEQNPQSALAYFARGVNAYKEIELINQFDMDNDQSVITGKTNFKVKNQKDEKYERALADFTKAVQLDPSFAFAYYNRAYIKGQLHDFNGALKDYDSALQADKGIADAYYNRGLLLLYFKDKLNACENFSKASAMELPESYAVIKKYCNRVR